MTWARGEYDSIHGQIVSNWRIENGRLTYDQIAQATNQPVGTVNFPNDHDYTRITEFKHLTGQEHPKPSIVYELLEK